MVECFWVCWFLWNLVSASAIECRLIALERTFAPGLNRLLLPHWTEVCTVWLCDRSHPYCGRAHKQTVYLSDLNRRSSVVCFTINRTLVAIEGTSTLSYSITLTLDRFVPTLERISARVQVSIVFYFIFLFFFFCLFVYFKLHIFYILVCCC